MRILLKKGKQKELIKNFKIKNNLTWNQLSSLLKIKCSRFMTYYNEDSLIPFRLYFILDKDNKYARYIIEKKGENWGQEKGGRLSKGKTKMINLPKESKELAEFYGAMLGDGNSNKTKGYKKGTYMIRIVGDIRKDNEYLTNYVKPLIEKLFNIGVRVGKFKKTNAMFIEAHSVLLIDFLEKLGFKPGNKIKNQLEIPKWIKDNKFYLKACLRGLYDTDGSAYQLTNQNSYQINFSNSNSVLLNDVKNGLRRLGIYCSEITKGDEINITKKSELRKFLKLIGFSNSKHLNKVKMWNIAPSSSGQIQ